MYSILLQPTINEISQMIKLLSLSQSLQPNSSNGFNTVEEINKVTNLVFSTKLFKCSYCLVVFFAL